MIGHALHAVQSNALVLPFALLSGLVMAGVALSLLGLCRTRDEVHAARRNAAAGQEACLAALMSMRAGLDGLASQIQDMRQQPTIAPVPPPPKPGLNLSKRSQALRMHRRGDTPGQIATALDVPLQEVNLLLKVHRIVINQI